MSTPALSKDAVPVETHSSDTEPLRSEKIELLYNAMALTNRGCFKHEIVRSATCDSRLRNRNVGIRWIKKVLLLPFGLVLFNDDYVGHYGRQLGNT